MDATTALFFKDNLKFKTHDPDEIHQVCDGCGRNTLVKDLTFDTLDVDHIFSVVPSYEYVEGTHVSSLCRICSQQVLESASQAIVWPIGMPVESWGAPVTGPTILSKLEKEEPAFVDAISRFVGGEVTYDDGSENTFLSEISRKVSTLHRYPTRKQIDAFVKVFGALRKQKAKDGILHKETPDEIGSRKKSSKLVLRIANENVGKFTGKTQDLIASFSEYYSKKGTLSVKQLNWLTKIIEDLPDAILDKYGEK